jgi:hypothetical protein
LQEGKWLSLLLITVALWFWERLRRIEGFSRPAEMFADQAGFEANLQG